ncbi:MAG: hypothetical protein PF961_21670 [Planctomycetota bacterium]|nr:hypothetical protein [Planctomycetota bacterium]
MHYKGQGVARSGAGTEIARLEWIGRPLQRGEPLPIILTTNFDRPWQQDPWAWETADPVDHNDPTVRQEIFDIVHGIRADMLDGSTESLKALSAIKFAEMATIYQDYQDTADKVIDIAKDYHEAGQLELVDFTAEDLILRPCCNGRLIQVLRYDYGHWAPALGTTTPDDPDAPDPIQWPIALGRIDGTWHALR